MAKMTAAEKRAFKQISKLSGVKPTKRQAKASATD